MNEKGHDYIYIYRDYLRSIGMDHHMIDDPPEDEASQAWSRDDARLLL